MEWFSIKITDCGVQLFIKGSSTALLAGFLMIVDAFAAEDEIGFNVAKKEKKIGKFMKNYENRVKF